MKIGENRKFSKNRDFLCGRTPQNLVRFDDSEKVFWRISKNSSNIDTTPESRKVLFYFAQKLFSPRRTGPKVEKNFGQKSTFFKNPKILVGKFLVSLGQKFLRSPRPLKRYVFGRWINIAHFWRDLTLLRGCAERSYTIFWVYIKYIEVWAYKERTKEIETISF